MGPKQSDEERIIQVLREGKQGRRLADLCLAHGISEQTYYRWKRKYEGMERADIKCLMQLEEENRRLRKQIADLTVDNEALKDALSRKW